MTTHAWQRALGPLLGAGVALGTASEAAAQTLKRGPYLQSGSDSRVTVCWRTDVPTDSRVEYGLDPGSLDSAVDDPASVINHAVTLTGLEPNTTYYYSIGTTSVVLAGGDAQHFLVTAPPPGRLRRSRVWVIGDSGTKDSSARVVRDAYYQATGTRHTDLWLMLGDNAYDSGYDDEYQLAVFENMYEARLIDTVLWPTYGNHDALSADSSTQSGVYYNIFHLPANGECGGVASGTEAYYSFDWGNAHFVCLDAMESDRLIGGPMITWLESDLAANDKEWVIAFWHHPPYSKGSHDSDGETELVEMRQNAVEKLEEYGVDLVLCGHSHSYERSFLIDGHRGKSASFDPLLHGKDMGDGRTNGDGAYGKPGAGMTPHEGAVYSVCGCSGKTENGPLNHAAMYVGLLQLGSLALDFYGAQLDARFLDEHGNALDSFTIVKGGATPVQVQSRVAVAKESEWRFDDRGVDLGTAWRDPTYDDSAWASGPGFLGYGESYIATTVSYGGDPNNKYITTYFRRSFELLAEPGEVTALVLRPNYDDGFVVYLNGTEVARRSMPSGTISYGTLATTHEAGNYETVDLTPFLDLLVKGTNVLAVELHQANRKSSDLVWDAEVAFDGFAPFLLSAARGNVDPRGGIPYDVLRVNGSTGGLGRSVDLADLGPLAIDVENPPTHSGSAKFALFAWFEVPTADDLVPLGGMGALCFPPVYWIANSLGVGPPGLLSSTPAPWSYTEPSVDGPLDLVLQGVIEENSNGRLRTTNAVLVQVR
jgi:hypothetical protein